MRRMLPSPAMLVALLALAVALGGTTYAAVKLKRNSVGPKQLKANAVTNPKVADGAIDTAELGTGAVTNPKVAANAIDGGRLADGAVNSAKVADGTLARGDASQGTLVTAYARINNPGAGDPQITGSVNVIDTDVIGADNAGNLIVTFTGLPQGSVGSCAVTTTPIAPSAGGLTPLTAREAFVGTGGGGLSASSVQVTTTIGGLAADSDFAIQVSCPPG